MLKILRKLLLTTVLLLPLTFISFADQPPDPGGGGPGGGDLPVGGGSPIGSGLVLLLSLGMGYGAKKVYQNKKRFSR
ncbi:MAG: hypothetical protein K8R86_13295 [Bacteroidales bacterium]|nr:hypothetical protein [Bacteroidales bacterium]